MTIFYPKHFIICALAMCAHTAYAKPAMPDFAPMIECKVPASVYMNFITDTFQNKKRMEQSGVHALKSSNPFLSEYHLAQPISVFGHSTDHIAFSASAILAVLDDTDPHPLAQSLGLVTSWDTSNQFMAVKLVDKSDFEKMDEFESWIETSLNVSTVRSHPNQVLAGCSYAYKDNGKM